MSRAPVAPAVQDCHSPVVQKRLSRIEANYDLLAELLSNLESRVPEELPVVAVEPFPKKPR